MKLISVKEYVDFKCSGGDCPICCCGGRWNINIDNKTAEYYFSLKGELGKELKEGIIEKDGIYRFKLNDMGECIFLNEDRLCKIQKSLGEEKLCDTCKIYPRLFYNVGDIKFCYLTNSCPEVNRMLLQNKESLEILYDDSDNQPIKMSDEDVVKFNFAINAYLNGINILKNRKLAISERLFLLLFFIEKFQNTMIGGGNPQNIIDIFSNEETYMYLLNNSQRPQVDCGGKIHAFMMVFSSMYTGYYDHPMWEKCKELVEAINGSEIENTDKLLETFARINGEMVEEMERLLTYRFFVTFMNGFKNNDYFDRLAYECMVYAAFQSYIALSEVLLEKKCSLEDKILFYSLCSRTDHASRRDSLGAKIKEEGYNELNKLLGITA